MSRFDDLPEPLRVAWVNYCIADDYTEEDARRFCHDTNSRWLGFAAGFNAVGNASVAIPGTDRQITQAQAVELGVMAVAPAHAVMPDGEGVYQAFCTRIREWKLDGIGDEDCADAPAGGAQ